MKWSKNQQRVIDTRNKNILVSAAAGSGKTSVLVERILTLIKNENDNIDSFLIVTFTNAAASGMKLKIQKSIMKSLKSESSNKDHLKMQINLLNKSNISTIHSFCIDVIRKNFHVIGIDPNFRVADTNEIDILFKDSIDEVLERFYGDKSQNFIDFVESFTKNRGDDELYEILENIYKYILSFSDPFQWLKDSIDMLNINSDNFENSTWFESIKNNISLLLEGASESLFLACDICIKPDGPDVYLEAIENDKKIVENLIKYINEDFRKFINNLYTLDFMKFKAIRKNSSEYIDEEKKEEVKSLREDYKKIIGKLKKMIPNKTLDEFCNDIKYMYETMTVLYDLIFDIHNEFTSRKTERTVVDFADIEHYALTILRNEDINKRYKQKFKYIFIDEYQDSNRIQEEILSLIKRDNNLFMVGDVKQSIYRFRLADPSIFNEKSKVYPTHDEKGENIRIDLNQNFRSRKEILDGINYIFANIMSEKLGEINYTEEVFLNSGALFDENEKNCIELNIIEKKTDELNEMEEDVDSEISSMKTAELEAEFAVKRARELLKENTYIQEKKEYRKIEYKDIVILMRAVSSWSSIFEEKFAGENIPFYFDGGSGYFETIEIQIVINLLKVIDNIRQDIPLLSVMRSPIGMFTTEELVKIRVLNPKYSYIDAIYSYKNTQNDYLKEKLDKFIEKIEKFKRKSRYKALDEFIWEIVNETGYYYYVGLLPKGNIRQANIRLLSDKAYDFGKTSMRGLFNFLIYIEKLNITSSDYQTAKTLGENDNVIRLMSIHTSKGLEFPVVIMCGLGKKFNEKDVKKNILYHNKYGIAPKYIDYHNRIYKETLARVAIKNSFKIENMSEEMRILYVGMTRAVDKLILVGSVDQVSKKMGRWKRGSSLYNIYVQNSYLDWICSCVLKKDDLKNNEIININYSINNKPYESKWLVEVRYPIEIVKSNKDNINDREIYIDNIKSIDTDSIDKNNYENIKRKLGFKYLYEDSINIPTKLSVTDLKVLKNESMESIKYKIPILRDIPEFKGVTKEFTKAEIGTITHFVMQHLDLSQNICIENIALQINYMVENHIITEKESQVVNTKKINNFFNTRLGTRMKNSKNIKREVPYVIKKKACEILDNVKLDDIILLQGIIDCYFYEGDEIVIIDYKTDDVSLYGVEKLKRIYEVQILAYKDAVERITKKRVKECYLYLFDIDEGVLINS